jgi:hypothetical protein
VKQFKITVGTITYSILQDACVYTVFENDMEVFKLKVTLGKNLVFFWETVEGITSQLISKIGLAIELYDLNRFL